MIIWQKEEKKEQLYLLNFQILWKQPETFLLWGYTTGWHRLVYVETYAGYKHHNMIDMANS